MRRVNFWLFLTMLAGLLISLPGLAEAQTKKVTIINDSGYADKQIYIIVDGIFPSDGLYHRLDWQTNTYLAVNTADNTVPVPGQTDLYCNYYTTLDQIKQADGTYSFTFPPMNGGRLWISLGKPVYLHINVPPPPPAPPSPPGVREPSTDNPSDPNYQTVFDKFEFAYDDAGLHANTTTVDFFCLPLSFEIKNGATSIGKRGISGSRGSVIQALRAKALLKSLEIPSRFYSPNNNNAAVSFPADYFDSYITYCWDYYKTHTLTITGVVDTQSFTASGRVKKINNVDTLVLEDKGNSETHSIAKPSSYQVFACAGVGVFNPVGTPKTPPCNRDGFVKDEVGSALNRTVMHLDFSQWSDSNRYYQPNGLTPDVYKTNIYSQILHQVSIGQKAYGYPWDDKYSQESYLSAVTATDLILTINNCKSSLVPVIYLLTDK